MMSNNRNSAIESTNAFTTKVEDLVREIVIQNNILYYRIESSVEHGGEDNFMPVIRVITYFEDTVSQISDLLSTEFEIMAESAVDKKKSQVESFSYKHIQYLVGLKANRRELTEYKRSGDKKFEIQICSMLQDAWAGIEKELGYDSASFPESGKRDLYRVGALLEMADLEFLKIRSKFIGQPEAIQPPVTKSALEEAIAAAPVYTAPVAPPATVAEVVAPVAEVKPEPAPIVAVAPPVQEIVVDDVVEEPVVAYKEEVAEPAASAPVAAQPEVVAAPITFPEPEIFSHPSFGHVAPQRAMPVYEAPAAPAPAPAGIAPKPAKVDMTEVKTPKVAASLMDKMEAAVAGIASTPVIASIIEHTKAVFAHEEPQVQAPPAPVMEAPVAQPAPAPVMEMPVQVPSAPVVAEVIAAVAPKVESFMPPAPAPIEVPKEIPTIQQVTPQTFTAEHLKVENPEALKVNAVGNIEHAAEVTPEDGSMPFFEDLLVEDQVVKTAKPTPLDENAPITDASLKEYVLKSKLLKEIDKQIAERAGAKINGDIDIEGDVERLRFLKVYTLKQLHDRLKDNNTDVVAFAEKWIGKDNGGSFDSGISLFYLEYLLVGKKNDPAFAVEYVVKFISDNDYSARYIIPTYNSIRSTEAPNFSHLTLK